MLDPATVRRIPRFSGLGEETETWLCGRLRLTRYATGTTIFYEGDPCDHFYMVHTGEVKVSKMLESGRELILDFFGKGEAFGEVALMDGDTFPANAVAHQNCEVLTLTRAEYLELLEGHPAAARSVIRDLTLRLHAMRRRVEVLGEGGVQSRIAQMLLIYARNVGREVDGGTLVPVQLSRNEVASLVCARMETVIRIMSRWQKEGLVRTANDGFLVPNPDALKAVALGNDG